MRGCMVENKTVLVLFKKSHSPQLFQAQSSHSTLTFSDSSPGCVVSLSADPIQYPMFGDDHPSCYVLNNRFLIIRNEKVFGCLKPPTLYFGLGNVNTVESV